MPTNAIDIAPYLDEMDRLFDHCGIEEDLRSNLLNPLLSEKARRATRNLSVDQLNNYDLWKQMILREHRLTAASYRIQFLQATREVGESCHQFLTRLTSALNYYLAARKVTDFNGLRQLILADRMRESLHPNSRHHIQDMEKGDWLNGTNIAEEIDRFEMSRGFNQKEFSNDRRKDFKQEKISSVHAVSISPKPADNEPEFKPKPNVTGSYKSMNGSWKQRTTCAHCGKVGHVRSECFKLTKPNSPRSSAVAGARSRESFRRCFFCSTATNIDKTHWTRQCDKRPKNVVPDACWICSSLQHQAKTCPKNKVKSIQRVALYSQADDGNLVEHPSRCTNGVSMTFKGQINLAGVVSPFICDSGAEISVLNYHMLPEDYTKKQSTGRYVQLQCAWGEITRAELVNIPAYFVDPNNLNKRRPTVRLCCAVTERLCRDTALLTPADVKVLQESAESCIPEVELITGTKIQYTDPSCQGDQTVRRIEEVIVSHHDRSSTIVPSGIKTLELADRQSADSQTFQKFGLAQKNDPTLQNAWKEAATEESKFYVKPENDLLYRKKDVAGSVIAQLVLPAEYREQIIVSAHDAVWSMHFGYKKTAQRIELYFWWPSIESQVLRYVKSCKECQLVTRRTKLDRIPITPVERGLQAFDVINIDLIGPLSVKSARGHSYVLCAICSLTRWPMAVPLKTLSAKELVDALLVLFSTCGIPRVIVSDNGTNMVSGLTREVYDRLGVTLRTATTYHPEGNSLVERWNQSLKKMLHHVMISEDAKNWDKKIPFLLWSYRELPNATTKVSPHMMVFGHAPKGPLSVLRDHWSGTKPADIPLPAKTAEYLELLKKDLDLVHTAAAENAEHMEKGYRNQYNLSAKEKSFSVGDQVLFLMPDSTHKLLSRWIGPGSVTAIVSDHSYRVALDSGAVKVLHANDLRLFVPRVQSLGVVFDDDEEFGRIEVYPGVEDTTFLDEVEKLEVSHLETDQVVQLKKLLHQYKDIFRTTPGLCNVVEHEINLVEGFKPIPKKQYRIPDKLKADIEEQVDKLLEDGKVRHSTSEYAHPIIAVNKPNGQVRLCCDLRMVNSGTINVAYPSVISEDILMTVSAANFISLCDCNSGYWQVPIRESDIHKTAFHSARGLLEWVVMPFGLKTASATFQRAMDIVLRPHSAYAGAYIDDTIVFSASWTEHLIHVERVLLAFRTAGMTLKLAKCQFGKQKVKFIGHMVGSGQRSVVQSKVDAIQAMPEPQNKKLLRSFLGMCSFYRPYIHDFAGISNPLTDLTKKRCSDKVRFDGQQRAAFLALKKALCEATTLHTPDGSRPYIIWSDASDYAVGAALAQKDDLDNEYPIAFASSKLSGAQLNWSTIEKEAYAIVYALQKFDHLVFGRKIFLFTDHNPLQYLMVAAPNSAKLTRWALALTRYDLTVSHIAGTENVTADCLSRCITI